jgi:stromal membrane-associated protein
MSKAQEDKQQAAFRAVLDKLLQEPENKFCADCRAAGARWASPKLGIFICMKCAGIHRGLGVHISFVRSVTLDKWKETEVQEMMGGNSRAAAIFEATLPVNFPRPSSDGIALEKFIRNKYVYKRYMLANGEAKPAAQVPPPQPKPEIKPVVHETLCRSTPKPAPQVIKAAPPAVSQEPLINPSLFSPQGQSVQQQQEAAKNSIMDLFGPSPVQYPTQQFPQMQPQAFPQQTPQMGQPQYTQEQYQQLYAQHYAQQQYAQLAQQGFFQQPQWPGAYGAQQAQPDAGGLEILSKIQSISQENRQAGQQVYF